MRKRVLALALAGALVLGASALAEDVLRAESDDWILTAPATLGTQADLDLSARAVQLCHDEIEKVIGHRPANAAKFTMTWQIGGGPVSYATTTGVVSLVPSDSWKLVDPSARSFRERIVRDGVCFGPHEITHVLTWESYGPLWPNEGFATFTDRMYDTTTWRCCSEPVPVNLSCDEHGYSYGPERRAYADLRQFRIDTVSYHTAACYWWEIHRLGGLPAIRGVLASMRRQPPSTAGQIVEHANLILNADLRPILARFGFTPAELTATPLSRAGLPCTLIGTEANDSFAGTAGADLMCGLAGNDALRAGDGDDRVVGGLGNDRLGGDAGADTLIAGAGADAVSGGAGNDLLEGRDGNDRLSGDAGADRLSAGGGADVLTGGPGADLLDAGPGADLIDARDGRRDVVIGGSGRDRARVDRRIDSVVGVEVRLP
jgi:hypothetical protein